MRQQGGKLTLGKLAALARGGGKGEYEVNSKKGRRAGKETFAIDLDELAGGPVELSKMVEFILSAVSRDMLTNFDFSTSNISS